MINEVQSGETMVYNNSGSAIASGDPVVIGERIGVAIVDIAATTGSGSVAMEGVFQLDKDADESFEQGDQLFYDSSDSTLTKTATGNTWAGYAHESALTADTSCKVRLQAKPKKAAFVADASAGSAAEINALRDALVEAGLMSDS